MEMRVSRVFDYPFRIFFLSTALWGVLVVPLWVAIVTGRLGISLAIPALQWHQHEMLFGFLSSAIAGFLLTAVCVWTNTERLYGARLVGLWLVWVLGRVVMVWDVGLPYSFIVLINILFLPLVVLDAGLRVWKARQRRQLVLVILLLLLWLLQCGFLWGSQPVWLEVALLSAFILMALIGGRITPTFSASWLKQKGQNADTVVLSPLLDKLALVSSLVLCATLFYDHYLGNSILIVFVAMICGFSHLIRILGWQGWRVRAEPLLWILHLSLLWIPVSLFMLAIGKLGWIGDKMWLHAGGIGALTSLILGVMARVSLGHTGRPLVLPSGMLTAFMLIQLAAIIRVATYADVINWRAGIIITAICWELAFVIFLWRYTRILLSPRADGKPG